MHSKYKSYILSGGKPHRKLEHYILMDYAQGELVCNADWVAEGYSEAEVSKAMARMVKDGWAIKLRRGVFQVL